MRPPIIGKTADGMRVVLERFEGAFVVPPHVDDAWLNAASAGRHLRTGAIVDLETTGLDARVDPVIEIAVRMFRYDVRNGDVVAAGERYGAFQDPGMPIPPFVVELTGISDAQVKGQAIDRAKVHALLSSADLIIAHNARFDRPRIEALMQGMPPRRAVWACSATHVEWTKKGFPSGKLEILALYHGFFVDAHRATADVDALLHLLMQGDPKSGERYLHELLVNARKDSYRVAATGSPIETKDLLRERRYRWKRDRSVWEKVISQDDIEAEQKWLAAHVYGGTSRATLVKVPRGERFLDEADEGPSNR